MMRHSDDAMAGMYSYHCSTCLTDSLGENAEYRIPSIRSHQDRAN